MQRSIRSREGYHTKMYDFIFTGREEVREFHPLVITSSGGLRKKSKVLKGRYCFFNVIVINKPTINYTAS